MFDFLATATAASSPKDALDRANFAVQDKLGRFMSLGSRVIALRDRATTGPQVEKANAILEGITTTQARALSVMGEAKALQESLTATPTIAAAKSSIGVAQDLLSINAEMDALMSRANAYAAEVGGAPAQAPARFLANVDRRYLLLGGLAALGLLLYINRRRFKL